jgi:hypothetical protein
MENGDNQQPQNNPVSPSASDDSRQTASTNTTQETSVADQNMSATYETQSPHFWNYIMLAFGVLIMLAIFLPKSTFAQNLGWPIIILGAIAGIKFATDSFLASKHSSLLIRPFIIFAGLGIGGVIFISCLIAAAVISFSKNPNPQSTG